MPEELPIDGPWATLEGEDDGTIMMVRTNTGYQRCGSVPGYEHQVGIAVRLNAPEATGLPSWKESAELITIEDAICPALEDKAESLLVAIITTGGMREFVFYTRAQQQVQKRFERLRDLIASHEIQLMISTRQGLERVRAISRR